MGITSTIYRVLFEKSQGHNLRRFKIVRNLNSKIQSRIKSDLAVVQGSKMYLGKGDNYNLSIFGIYEPKETQLVKDQIHEDNNVLDLGSSIGYYTLLFSRLIGKNGKVFSFESNSKKFKILQENVQKNEYTNVILENKAVSNKNGEAIIFNEKATTITLDSYFRDKELRIDFIKMDIEGH